MVADASGLIPVTVRVSIDPDGVPTETDPAETVGVVQV